MPGKFELKKFNNLDINDPFFDSLKKDYPGNVESTGFIEWFEKKSKHEDKALVYSDDMGIAAFIVLKEEFEAVELRNSALPAKHRLKISTFKISDRISGKRIGEGAVGLILWKWQKSQCDEIYATSFDKHGTLITLLERFSFEIVDFNKNGEAVLLKTKKNIDYSCAHSSFPFIKRELDYAGYLIVEDHFHDKVFAYSKLKNHKQLEDEVKQNVSNGLTKIYVGNLSSTNYYIGEPILIYRKYTGGQGARYRSCITSYCVVTNIIQIKRQGRYLKNFEDLIEYTKNKTVYKKKELLEKYNQDYNMVLIEMLYYGYFGAGNNVNMDWLDKNDCWVKNENYPTQIKLSESQFEKVLKEGKIDVSNVIID